jgi:RNA polymerase sigma-70 factor (ECF subfamily)
VDDLDTLLARCRRGDAPAWEELVRRYQGRVYGFALHYLRDREEAKDAAQEIFVKVYQHLGNVRNGQTFLPWLLRLARNGCIDKVRSRGTRDPFAQDDRTPATPEDALFAESRASLLYRAIGKLNAANREIVLLKDIEELTLPAIAAKLGLPLGTVKSRSNRARGELAKIVRSLAGEPAAAS